MARPFELTGNPDADALLQRDDDALLAGMLLDQQVTMEKAFAGPWVVAQRMGTDGFDVAAVAAMPADDFVQLASTPPAIHRFPGSMGQRLHDLCVALVDDWGGHASALWSDGADGATVLKRLRTLPGFGDQKARIFLAVLGKQRQLDIRGWREAAKEYGDEQYRSVADITDADSLQKVRATKKAVKAAARAAKSTPDARS